MRSQSGQYFPHWAAIIVAYGARSCRDRDYGKGWEAPHGDGRASALFPRQKTTP